MLITFEDAFEETAEHALLLRRHYGLTATVFVITALSRASDSFEGQRVMTGNQIRYWVQRGIELGSHTRTHPDLSAPDPAAIESAASARELEEIVDERVKSFVYPHGRLSDYVRCIMG